MRCPSCKNPLRQEKVDYVTFDICSNCRGIWVTGEQFRALAARVAADGDIKSDEKLTFEPRKVLRPMPDNSIARMCPHCNTAMREFNYAYDSNVFLDRCEQCEGIWLDTNEILDIAKHIQYNPKMHVLGKSLLDLKGGSAEQELTKTELIIQVAIIILRLLIFRF